MARSFSTAKIVTAVVVDGLSNAVSRRGFSASSQGVASNVARAGVTTASRSPAKKSGEEVSGATDKVSWIPDPVTGYYRPDSGVQEIDVAELRAMLLKKN